jgi:hypothetical protein
MDFLVLSLGIQIIGARWLYEIVFSGFHVTVYSGFHV